MRRFCVQTASWNADAIRFYERQGFVLEARLPAYFGDGNDMVWLGRDLR
jgi:ribosomal protein S18 acetylase RimI-like enzyme